MAVSMVQRGVRGADTHCTISDRIPPQNTQKKQVRMMLLFRQIHILLTSLQKGKAVRTDDGWKHEYPVA